MYVFVSLFRCLNLAPISLQWLVLYMKKKQKSFIIALLEKMKERRRTFFNFFDLENIYLYKFLNYTKHIYCISTSFKCLMNWPWTDHERMRPSTQSHCYPILQYVAHKMHFELHSLSLTLQDQIEKRNCKLLLLEVSNVVADVIQKPTAGYLKWVDLMLGFNWILRIGVE